MALLALPVESIVDLSPATLERATSESSLEVDSNCKSNSTTSDSIPTPELRRSRSAPSSASADLSPLLSPDLSPAQHGGYTPGTFQTSPAAHEPDEMEQEWLEAQLEKPDQMEQMWLDEQLDQEDSVRQMEFEEFYRWQIQQNELEEMEREMEQEVTQEGEMHTTAPQ